MEIQIKNKLSEDKFSPLFGDWWPKFRPFFLNGGFDPIYKFLKEESLRGKRLAPVSSLVYRCFKETSINDCKVVLAGFCPYHTFSKDHGSIADGLCMGCSVTGKLQPSLRAFYQGIEKELYNDLNTSFNYNPDVSYLAKQGVLMYNVSLTTEDSKPGKHQEIWSDFTKYFFENVVGYTGVPVIFLGNEAAKYEKSVTPFTHYFKVKHPAYYAKIEEPFDGEGAFKKVNQIIWENNGFRINWLEKNDN